MLLAFSIAKKIILFGTFFAISFSSSSQWAGKIDSLKKDLAIRKQDSLKVKTLIRLANAYNLDKPDSSLKFGLQAYNLAKKIMWKKGLAVSCYWIGLAYNNSGQFENALNYRLQELEFRKEMKDTFNICSVLGTIGVSYSDMGDNKTAARYYFDALKAAEKAKNKEEIMNCLTNIASLYSAQKNYEKAIEFYFRSLEMARSENIPDKLSINYGNLGSVYLDQKNIAVALYYFNNAFEIAKRNGFSQHMAGWIINTAGAYQLQADSALETGDSLLARTKTQAALDAFSKGLSLSEELGNDYLRANALGNIGEILTAQRQFSKAEKYLLTALSLAEVIKAPDEAEIDHKRLHKLYSATRKFDLALMHFEKHSAIKDSLYALENKKLIAELEHKYNSEKQSAQNASLKLENELQGLALVHNRYITLGLICLVVVILILTFVFFRQRKIRSSQAATQLQQKLLRTQMNPHFIFNSLASIESFIYEHQPKEAGVYLSRLSRLMRLILENSTEDYITLEREIEILNNYLSLQKLRLDDQLSYSIEVGPGINPAYTKLPPMLLQPFVENAIEHGIRNSEKKGLLTVSFLLKNGFLELLVMDNGVGIHETQNEKNKEHTSLAIKITRERLALLNKSKKVKMSFEITNIEDESHHNSGTKVTFLIPMT